MRPLSCLLIVSYFTTSLRSGLRGRAFQAVFILGLLLVAFAYLAAMFSPRQPETVALDVGFSGVRFSLILLALFWVQDLVGKEIERKTAILYLAYPVPRSHYILGRFFGIATLLLLASIVFGLLLWLAAMASGDEYQQSHPVALGLPFWATILGLWLSVVVITAFALWIATLSTVPALPLALGMAFSFAGLSLGAVVDYLMRGADGQTDLVAKYGPIVESIRWVLPDLSRLDWRSWPMYDLALSSSWLAWSVLMALAYTFLMLGLAIPIFNRREFD